LCYQCVITAVIVKVRAERRLGEILAATERNKGGDPVTATTPVAVKPPTLAELGLSDNDSSRFQQIAALPEGAWPADAARRGAGHLRGIITRAVRLRLGSWRIRLGL
jgi:hypothetical protein